MRNEYQELLLEDLTILTAYHAYQHDAALINYNMKEMYEERIIEMCSTEGTLLTEMYRDWLMEDGIRICSYHNVAPTPLVFVTSELTKILANFFFYEKCLVEHYRTSDVFGTAMNVKFEEDCALGDE